MPLVMSRNGYPEETWWSFSYSPVRDESETIAGLLNVTFDATARKRAEDARDSSQRLQAAVLEVLPIGLALADTKGRILLSNREWDQFVTGGLMPSRDAEHTGRWRAWDNDGQAVDARNFPAEKALRGEAQVPGISMLYTDESGKE